VEAAVKAMIVGMTYDAASPFDALPRLTVKLQGVVSLFSPSRAWLSDAEVTLVAPDAETMGRLRGLYEAGTLLDVNISLPDRGELALEDKV
jgi:hypothetical protein